MYILCVPNPKGGAITDPSSVLDVFLDRIVPTESSLYSFGLSAPTTIDGLFVLILLLESALLSAFVSALASVSPSCGALNA